MQAMGDNGGISPSLIYKKGGLPGRAGRKQGSSVSSDISDTERECRVPQHMDSQKGDAEEGRTTDDDLASCSDHLSVEGSNTDETRPNPSQETAWPCASFSLSSDATRSQLAAPNSETNQQLKLARLLLSRNKAKEALNVLDNLGVHPDADMLCLRGQCCSAMGNNALAFACFSNALALVPRHRDTLVAAAALYKSCGLLPEAERSLEMALEEHQHDEVIKQALAVVYTDLGTKLKMSGRLEEGFAKYQRAVSTWSAYAPGYYNIGVIHSERRNFAAAKEMYELAIQCNPSYPEAHCNLGVIHKEEGRLEEAIASYERALAISPEFAIVANNLAIALTEMGTRVKVAGDMAGGIAAYERALMYNAKHADALYNLGVACGETGQVSRAIFLYELAIHFNPSCAEAWNNLGVLQRDMGNFERAFVCYQSALQLRPNFPQGLNNLAVIFTAQGRAQDALQMLQAAIAAAPDYAEAYNNLGVLQREVGAIKDALASYSKCLELAPRSRNAGQNRLLALNYIHEDTAEAHEQWGMQFQQLHEPLPADYDAAFSNPDRPLIVGYVSPDLFTHSVSYFAEAPLTRHQSSRVHHIIYSCVPRADAKTLRLQAAVKAAGGVWRDVVTLSEPDLARLVRQDRVDILVDLTGHTANNRLGTFAMRPAPIQVTWIGYPNTTGLSAVDFRFTDAVADPPDTRQAFVEELVRLPGCFLCYTPAVDAAPVSALPAAANGFVTFGSFNNMAKITPRVMAVWARILNVLPTSRLVLKNKPFACASARLHILNQLAAAGVEASRVDLLPLAAANADHLATYSLMDISLDPFPYAGTTTTCESLFMGVPVITLSGSCHAHNVGVSLLEAMDMREGWVCDSEEAYVQQAVAAAADIEALVRLRGRLRQHMLASRLCDAPAFVRRLEDVYRRLWADKARQQNLSQQQQRQEPSCTGTADQ